MSLSWPRWLLPVGLGVTLATATSVTARVGLARSDLVGPQWPKVVIPAYLAVFYLVLSWIVRYRRSIGRRVSTWSTRRPPWASSSRIGGGLTPISAVAAGLQAIGWFVLLCAWIVWMIFTVYVAMDVAKSPDARLHTEPPAWLPWSGGYLLTGGVVLLCASLMARRPTLPAPRPEDRL